MRTSMKNRWVTAWMVVAALTLGGFATAAHAEAEDAEDKAEPEVKTITGKLIDAREYLLWGVEGKPDAEEERGGLAGFFTRTPDAPLLLLPDEESLDLIERIIPGEKVFLMIFDPEASESRDAYRTAQDEVGNAVHVTGTLHARDGVHAISVLSVIEHPAEETAEAAPEE